MAKKLKLNKCLFESNDLDEVIANHMDSILSDEQQKANLDNLDKQLSRPSSSFTGKLNPNKIKALDIEHPDGTIETIPLPAYIAQAEMYKREYVKYYPELAAWYATSPIIWTFDIPTAATDGKSIAFNPLFLVNLFDMGQDAYDAEFAKLGDMPDRATDPRAYNNYMSSVKQLQQTVKPRFFWWVMTHEVFHQLYDHLRRSALHCLPMEMELANIAEDTEINRDIEIFYPEFKGCVDTFGGCIDRERYPVEVFETIFDDMKENGVQPKHKGNKQQNNQNGQKGQQGQSGQQGQQGQSGQGQGSGDNNGENPLDNMSDMEKAGFLKALEDYQAGKLQI